MAIIYFCRRWWLTKSSFAFEVMDKNNNQKEQRKKIIPVPGILMSLWQVVNNTAPFYSRLTHTWLYWVLYCYLLFTIAISLSELYFVEALLYLKSRLAGFLYPVFFFLIYNAAKVEVTHKQIHSVLKKEKMLRAIRGWWGESEYY